MKLFDALKEYSLKEALHKSKLLHRLQYALRFLATLLSVIIFIAVIGLMILSLMVVSFI